MGLMQYMLIFATIMVFVVIYLGVRDQYKSQEEITKRNYELERYYDSIDVGDAFESKIGNFLFKVNSKKFKSIELEEIRFDGAQHIVWVDIETLFQEYRYHGKDNQESIMF